MRPASSLRLPPMPKPPLRGPQSSPHPPSRRSRPCRRRSIRSATRSKRFAATRLGSGRNVMRKPAVSTLSSNFSTPIPTLRNLNHLHKMCCSRSLCGQCGLLDFIAVQRGMRYALFRQLGNCSGKV